MTLSSYLDTVCRIDGCAKTQIDAQWSTCDEHSRCVALGCIARRVHELEPFCETHMKDEKLLQAWLEL